jgi:hypothetical protein
MCRSVETGNTPPTLHPVGMHPHGMHMLNGNGIFYRAMHPDGMRNIFSMNNE